LTLHWHPANPAKNLAGAGFGGISKNGWILDLPEPELKSGTTLLLLKLKKLKPSKTLNKKPVLEF